MYSYRPSSTAMATDVIRPNSGTQPPGHRGRVSGSSPLSSAGSTGSHRNKKLLKSYHDFTMQIFSTGQGSGESDSLFVAAVRSGDYERVENLLQRRSHEVVNVDSRDRETGNTALMWAVLKGHMKLIRLLLKYGADVTLRNAATETVLDLTDDHQIRKLLLESVLRKGVSPRHLLQAAWQGNVQVVRQLLNESKILDINCRNSDGFTPLLLVTRDVELFETIGSALESYDPLAVIEELLRHRADPAATDRDSHTALHYVSTGTSPLSDDMALRLMQIPALATSSDARSVAPIHVASKSGSVEVVVALLDHGVDVNTRGYAGSTPLHVSASAGQTQVANTLLNHGADITLVDDSGNTAVDVAKTKRMKSVLREAWMEQADSKQAEVLSPVKPPSRMEDRSPRQTRVHSLTSSSPPSDGFGKRMLQKFSEAHKVVQEEEQLLKDIEAGRFTPGLQTKPLTLLRTPSRNSPLPSTTNRAPAPPKTPRVLDPLTSPASKTKASEGQGSKKPRRSLTFSGRVNSPTKDQKSRGHSKVTKTRSDPTGHQLGGDASQVPVTVVGLDLDDSLRDVRFQRILPPTGKHPDQHSSTQSDSSLCKQRWGPTQHRTSDPSISDIAKVYQKFCNKDISSSPALAQAHPIRTSQLLNLEQMHLRLTTPSPNPDASSLYPTSRSILPSSPGVFGDNRQLQETIFEFEDEEDGGKDGKDDDEREDVVPPLRLSVEEEDGGAVLQNRSVMFNIEASRVNPLKDSSDSGQGSSRSTVSHTSSAASLVMSSPSPQLELDRKEAAKNRLGIKMTPSATEVPDGRVALFQRPQTRLPSLGRASPAIIPHKLKRESPEERISVLSMSSINAVMSSDTTESTKGSQQRKLSAAKDELEHTLQRSQNCEGHQWGKRKISLEDNSMLIDTRKRASSIGESKLLTPISASQSITTAPLIGSTAAGMAKKSDEKLSRDTAGNSSRRNTAIVTPLCATKGKSSICQTGKSNVQKTMQNFTCTNTAGTGYPTRKVTEKSSKSGPATETRKGNLVGSSKPVIRTLEVLPVAKEGTRISCNDSDKDSAKNTHTESSRIASSVKNIETKGEVQNEKTSTSNRPKKVAEKQKELSCKTKKEKTESNSAKTSSDLSNKKSATDRKAVREPDVKKERRSAIKMDAAVVSNKIGNKKSDQGEAKTVKSPVEDKKETTWRIICDDDSSDSEFENDDSRFVEESSRQGKQGQTGQKDTRKTSTLPTSTKMEDFEDLVESSDAEDVFEEVVFSGEEDSTDTGKPATKCKDRTKATVKDHKTSGPKGTKIGEEKSDGKPAPKKTSGIQQKTSNAQKTTASVQRHKTTPSHQQLKKTPQQQKSAADELRQIAATVSQKQKTNPSDQQKTKAPSVQPPQGNVKDTVKKPSKMDAQNDAAKSKGTPKGNPVKKNTTKEPLHSSLTSSKAFSNRNTSSLVVTNKSANMPTTSKNEKEVAKTKIPENKNVIAQKEKPTQVVLDSKDSVSQSNIKEKSMPKHLPEKSDSKKVVSPQKIEKGVQNAKDGNKPSLSEIKDGVTKKIFDQDKLVSEGLNQASDGVGLNSSGNPSKVTGESSEVKPAGQEYIDPAVKVVVSEQKSDLHLNPVSPKEPKPGHNALRKGKYKSPDTSPRDNTKSVPERKPIRDPMAAKQSPVIMDIVEMFKSASSGSNPDVKLEVLGKIKAGVKGPVRKLVKSVPKKVSGTTSGKGTKWKTKERAGSGGKKGRVGSGGSRDSENAKTRKAKKPNVRKSRKKAKDVDYSLLPDSEQNTTAFITGQGWSIKTSRNENDDVIIQEDNEKESSFSDDDHLDLPGLGEVHLSPHNSLKLDELVVMKSISIEEKKNLVNILSPLEMNAPLFIPDTMGTIKEFADSLKSTSSSEMSIAKIASKDDNCNTGVPDIDAVEKSETQNAVDPGQADSKGSPPVPDVRVRKSSTHSQEAEMNNIGQDRSLGLTGELSNYNTNPDLLKVFRIKDHYETPSPQESRRTSIASDEEQVRQHLSLILDKPDSGSSDANEESGQGRIVQPKENSQEQSIHPKANVLKKKPPLPKPLLQHQIQSSKRPSPRRSSDPNPTPSAPVKKLSQKETEPNNSQVSNIKNSLPDKKFSPPSSSSVKRRGKSLGDTPSDASNHDDSHSSSKPAVHLKTPIFEEDALQDSADDDEVVEEEEPLTRHIQTLTEKTLQEFESIAQSIDATTTSIIHTRPPSSIAAQTVSTARSSTRSDSPKTGQTVSTARSSIRSISPRTGDVINIHGGEQEENDFLNQSIALSEASSEVFRDFNESGEHALSSQGASMSSSMVSSTERSLSANTTVSESEGTELLHWKKGNLLGKGAFGTVYCGLTNTGQLLAVKQVELSDRDKDKAKQQYQKLQEEVQLLKTLRHKNIVGFLGVSLEDNTVNIFMQFIPGGSIASLLARFGSLDETVFCRYTKQILEGTQYLHENNVIHRDIKGANIMLMSTGVIKLIDFGCAKRLCIQISRSQNVLKSMRGTPYWMAPEVIMETGHGRKSDIWSIGCTVFEMATRKPPWSEMRPMAAIFAIGSGGPIPQMPDKFSEDARTFVNACLTRDQDQRPTARELLKHPFIKRRKERGREHYQTRISSTSLDEGPIVFREQPISRDSAESRGRKNYAPQEFR